MFRKIDKDGAAAFMSVFDAIKDFEIDFRDIKESNSQYDNVFSSFGKVLDDLLYRNYEQNVCFRTKCVS